jgi:hypothetical protein
MNKIIILIILIILFIFFIYNSNYIFKEQFYANNGSGIVGEVIPTSSSMMPTSSSMMPTSSSMMPTSSSNSYPNMCKFVPWGNTKNNCTTTCLNSKYKDLYSLGNHNCNIDTCNTKCEDCKNHRCLWNTPTFPVTNVVIDTCINIDQHKQSPSKINIFIDDAPTTTSVGSPHSYTYIIHYRDTENNNITILNLNNNDNVIFNVSSDVKINHKPKFLKPNKIYNLIMYKMDSNNIKCKSNILNITT